MLLGHIGHDTLPADIHAIGEHRSIGYDDIQLDR